MRSIPFFIHFHGVHSLQAARKVQNTWNLSFRISKNSLG